MSAQKEKLIQGLKGIYRWTDMAHAWRFNGVVDIYKKALTAFCKPEGKTENFSSINDLERWVVSKLSAHNEQRDFQRKDGRKVTYREFHRQVRQNNQLLSTFRAEDYVWTNGKDENSQDHLYFLFHDGMVKIGRSKNVQARIDALKTSLSHAYKCMVLPNKGCLEKAFHKAFEDLHSAREWFKSDLRIVNFIYNRVQAKECYRHTSIDKKRLTIKPRTTGM